MESRQLHVDINREAARLEHAARLIRREAGGLRYHPVTGLARRPDAEFEAALAILRDSLKKVDGWTRALGPEAEHVRPLAHQLQVALDVLAQALARPERGTLDAPYGMGTPRRPHPGAQATWAAERAEGLARALARLAVAGENPADDRAPDSARARTP